MKLAWINQIVLVGEQRIAAVTGIQALLHKFAERHIGARTITVINNDGIPIISYADLTNSNLKVAFLPSLR